MAIEKYMFYYMDTISKKSFKEAVELANEMLEMCKDESTQVIEGLLSAAKSLEYLKVGDFDEVEALWEQFEESKRFLTPQNRHYSILLETILILENSKEEIERII